MARSSPGAPARSVGIVTAAGSAQRFGGAKLLAKVGGAPLLERTIRSLLGGGVDRVVVVLGAEADAVRRAVPAFGEKTVTSVVNPEPERGMFSSLQTGAAEASGDPLVILPGDMPYVEPATVAALLARYGEGEAIVGPRFKGKRGHPVVLPGRYTREIVDAGPGVTLHELLRAHASERVDIDVYDHGVVRDVDVPTDLDERGAASP